MLRAVARYLRQVGIPFSDRYMEQHAARRTPSVARALVELFHARFDPDGDRDRGRRRARPRSRRRSTPSTSLDEDRILRGFLSVVRAMLRTNYYLDKPYVLVQARPDADPADAAAAAALRDLRALAAGRGRAPARRVGRPRRPALVRPARGLPHRDPRPDEGADGQERADRAGRRQGRLRGQARRRRGRRSVYTTFISGAAGHHRHVSPTARSCRPTGVVRHDGDDPYLVVAADKGTATFSDIANGIAEDYGFWLGDAFASGGSVGYDHKAMGITARVGVGVGPAPLPRARRRRPERGLHRRRHRRHVRRRVRQRHAAVASTSGSWPRSTTATSSSTRTPTRRPRSPSARRLFELPRSSWDGLRRVADLRGRRRVPAHGEVDPAVRAGARGAWTSTPSG